MTTLPTSVTRRLDAATPATSAVDAGATLRSASAIINLAYALLLPLGALLAGLFALGLDVTGLFYGASGFLLRGALIVTGFWVVLWAVRAGIRAIAQALPFQRIQELFLLKGMTETAGTDSMSGEVARPKLALPKDSPAHRFGATLDN